MNLDHASFSVMVANWVLAAGIGIAIGWMHYRSLCWNTRLYLGHGRLWLALGTHVARFAATAIALYTCAKMGISLPALLGGLMGARQYIVHWKK